MMRPDTKVEKVYLYLKPVDFRRPPGRTDEVIELTVQKLNLLLDGFDLWRNRPHQVWNLDFSPGSV